MFRRSIGLGVIAIAIGLVLAAPRSEAEIDPRAFIHTLGDAGIQTLSPNVPPQMRLARFRDLFQNDFDVVGIGRFAIGRYWQALSPDQQQEFLRLFREYTVKAYADKLGQYGGARFEVTGSQPADDGAIVTSEVIRPTGSPVEIDWHLIRQDGQYKVSDVYVDRVSMKITQRDEFAKIIQNNGGRPGALLAVLRQELGDDGSAPSVPAR